MQGHSHPDEDRIINLYQAWTDAIRAHDDATLARLLADDFLFTDARGRWGKPRFVENVRRWTLMGWESDDVEVRRYGDVAVMFAHVALSARLDGRDMSGEWFLTDIWVQRNSEWQVVSRQWSQSSSPAATPVP